MWGKKVLIFFQLLLLLKIKHVVSDLILAIGTIYEV